MAQIAYNSTKIIVIKYHDKYRSMVRIFNWHVKSLQLKIEANQIFPTCAVVE